MTVIRLRIVDTVTDHVVADFTTDPSHGTIGQNVVMLPVTPDSSAVRQYRLELSEIAAQGDPAVHTGLPKDWDNLPPARDMSDLDAAYGYADGHTQTGGTEGRL